MGGYSTYLNPCTKGHFGPLCKSCDTYGINYNKIKYHATKTKTCNVCPEHNNIEIVIFLISLLYPIVMVTVTLTISIKAIDH